MSKSAAVFNKKKFINDVTETVRHMYRKQLKEASQQEIFQAVSYVVKDVVIDDWLATQQAFDDQDPKIVYYMSMEFLMGRALGNNLINLKAYKEVKEALEEIGLNLDVIEDQEPDPHSETVVLDVLQHVLWNHWQHLDTQLTAAVSVTVMVCSNSRFRMVFR